MSGNRLQINFQEGEEKRLFEKISQSPHQISNYRRLARLLDQRKRFDEAAIVLKKAVNHLPPERLREIKEIQNQLARVYEGAGELSRAARTYRKLIRNYPDDFLPYERLERIYKNRGQRKLMVSILRGVDKGNPQRERALKQLLRLHKDLNEPKVARRYLKMLIEEFGPNYTRLKNLGRLNEKLGQPRPAIACYREAHKFKPDSSDVVMMLGICQLKVGDRANARRTFRRLLGIKHGFYSGHIQLAEMDIEDGAFQKAGEHLRRLEARWPGNSRVNLNQAYILLRQGDPRQSLDRAREAFKSTPFYYTDELSLGYTVIGEAHETLGEDKEAHYYRLMARRVKGSSDFFRTAAGLADELITNGDFHSARCLADDLLNRFPGNSFFCIKKAEVLLRQGDPEAAIKYASRASRESNRRYLKDKIRGLEVLAELYEARGETGKAREARAEALDSQKTEKNG